MPGKDFDALLPGEREFTVRGKKFHYLDLSPEDVFSDVEVPKNGSSPWDISDLQILRFLPESEHEAWRNLRADQESPVTIKQINAVFAWLWEEATGIPLPQAELSPTGAGKTVTSSTGKSR
jgi:hypothetical protein